MCIKKKKKKAITERQISDHNNKEQSLFSENEIRSVKNYHVI